MADSLKSTRKGILRIAGRLSGSILGFFGVITTACGEIPTAYGIPPYDFSLTFQGRVMSVSDSSGIDNIYLELLTFDSLEVLGLSGTDSFGYYQIGCGTRDEVLWPDTFLLKAVDPAGQWPDTFQDFDTLLYAPYIGTNTLIEVDLYLHPYGEE